MGFLQLFLLCPYIVLGDLVFQPFGDKRISCADGSSAGIYSSLYDATLGLQELDSSKHIIVFEGGGACTSPTECAEEARSEPYKFSSSMLPRRIRGDSILSQDAKEENPFQNFTKWLVPYCSQDLYLGDMLKGKIGDFVHAGSTIFQESIRHWQHSAKTVSRKRVDHLVVVGISAGAIGVMNHVGVIKDAARKSWVDNLQFILDAPSVSDQWDDKNFASAMDTYVDLLKYPLCDSSNAISRHFNGALSDLPCCLSTHCMFRHDEHFSSIGSLVGERDEMPKESILLLDSAYDPLALAASHTEPLDTQKRFIDVMNKVWSGAETAGSRLTRPMETSAWLSISRQESLDNIFNKKSPHPGRGRTSQSSSSRSSCRGRTCRDSQEAPATDASLATDGRAWEEGGQALVAAAAEPDSMGTKGKWVIASCVTHGFFVPSVEILQLPCLFGDYEAKEYIVHCKDNGAGLKRKFEQVDMMVTLWHTTDIWNLAIVKGRSVREIVAEYVGYDEALPALDQNGPYMNVVVDDCNGPNCNLDGGTNQCQALFELEETFVPAPMYLKALGYLVIGVIISSVLARFSCSRKLSAVPEVEDGESGTRRQKKRVTSAKEDEICSVEKLSVSSSLASSAYLLVDISLKIRASSVTALLGRSGSGKTTLLKVLSQQRLDGLRVSGGSIHTTCSGSDIAYLRQTDAVRMERMTASAYLGITASIYGANTKQVSDCINFVKSLYCREQGSDLDPYQDVKIKDLSGGQRRILAIASTFLLTPRLVLLDEPLSGLDDASSVLVMKFVNILATHYACAVVMSLHNPASELLAFIDRAVLLDNGKVKLEISQSLTLNSGVTFTERFRSELSLLMSSFVGSSASILSKEGPREEIVSSMVEPLPENKLSSELEFRGEETHTGSLGDQKPARRKPAGVKTSGLVQLQRNSIRDKESTPSPPPTGASCSKLCSFSKLSSEVVYISRRLHANFSSDLHDLVTLPIVLMLFGMVLRFDGGSPVQDVLVTTFFIGIPVNLFRHKIHLSCKMWTVHRMELDDGRISLLAYQLASQAFTFAVPLVSLIAAHLLGYAVLGWHFISLPVQVLFSAVHLLVALQIGRTSCVYFRGDYRKFSKVYSVYIFLSFLFGGLLVPTRQLPAWLSWMYVVSFTFWAISGAALNVLQYRGETEHCVDALSCIATDGAFIARYMGFSPLSNEFLAFVVLVIWFVVLSVAEYFLLQHRCALGKLAKASKPLSKWSKCHRNYKGRYLPLNTRKRGKMAGSCRLKIRDNEDPRNRDEVHELFVENE